MPGDENHRDVLARRLLVDPIETVEHGIARPPAIAWWGADRYAIVKAWRVITHGLDKIVGVLGGETQVQLRVFVSRDPDGQDV